MMASNVVETIVLDTRGLNWATGDRRAVHVGIELPGCGERSHAQAAAPSGCSRGRYSPTSSRTRRAARARGGVAAGRSAKEVKEGVSWPLIAAPAPPDTCAAMPQEYILYKAVPWGVGGRLLARTHDGRECTWRLRAP